VAGILLLATFTLAQDSQFFFDPNGNLLMQTGASNAPPQIIGQPQNRFVAPNESASFFVVAKDTRGLSYQWRFNGGDIAGATNDAVLLHNVSTNHEGEYRVVLTNPSGSVTSAPAMLFFDSDADGVADSWETTFFGSLTNSATVDTDGDGSSNFQEYLDGTNPADANSVLRHITIVRDGGSVIANPGQLGYTNGQTVTLTATALPGEEPFHAWLGDVVTRSNSITLVMTNNKTLHARFTPIFFTWTNVAGGDWNVAANWSPSLGVGSNDSVTINSSVTVTLNTPADCADVTLGSAGSTPTLTGSGALTVHRSFAWTSGNMTGSGRTVLEPGSLLTIFNPALVSVQNRTLENGGMLLWTGAGNLAVFNGAVITNRAGALFHVQSPASLSGNGFDSGRIDNVGTFRKSVYSGTMTIGAGTTFNNSGTVDLQTGGLDLSGGGTHSGSFVVPAGTALILSGGTHTGNGSSSIAGAGQFTVSGGTTTLAGSVNVSGSNRFSGGIATFTGNTICTNNTVTISGGTVNYSGTGLVSPSVVSLSSGALGGTSTVTVNNVMNWTGGNMTGTGRTIIAAGATLNIANPAPVPVQNRTLENGGMLLWTGAGNLAVFNGAVITNRAGALFHVQGPASLSGNGFDSGRIDNAGTFRKSVYSGTMTIGAGTTFNNSGTVDLQTGILAANGGFTPTAGALLSCVLGGTTPGVGYSQLQVGGSVALAGNLSLSLANNFVPPANSVYTVLSAGSRTGSFASFIYPTNAADLVLSNAPNSVIVRALGPYFATTTLPDAMRNVGYTQQVTAVMSSNPIVYSVIAGALPDGLSFSSGGLISGMPTNFGNSLFTVQAADAGGVTIQQAFNLRVRNLPPEGLISWWRAENNALDSISTNHGVLTNGATHAAGKVDQAFSFDGVNDYVSVPDATNLRPASITLEAWAKFNGMQGPVLGRALGAGVHNSYLIWQQNGNINGVIEDASQTGLVLSAPLAPVAGQWYHVALTFDDITKQQVLYLNGVVVASGQSLRRIGYDNHPVVIGGDIDNGSVSFLLNGGVDEAAIYNRALSSNEIVAIFNAGSAGKPANTPYFVTSAQLADAVTMVGYTQLVSVVLGTSPITFSAPSGGLPSGLNLSSNGILSGIPLVAGTNSFILRATDSLGAFSDQLTTLRVIAPVPAPSGLISWWRAEGNALDSAGANHGTASNGVVYVQGKVGQAFGFDGINDFVWVPDAPDLRPMSITLEAWARFNGTQGPVLGRSWGAGVHNSYIIWQLSGNLNGTIGDALGADILSVPFAPATNRWYHVAFTFDDVTKQQAFYLDGALVGYNQSPRSIAYDSHPVVIGGDIDNGTVSFRLNGGVDEAAI